MQQAAGAAQEAEELSSQASSSEPPSPTAATEAPQEQPHQRDHLQQLLDPGTLLAAGNAAGQKASGVMRGAAAVAKCGGMDDMQAPLSALHAPCCGACSALHLLLARLCVYIRL